MFIKAALDKDIKSFLTYVAFFALKMSIHLAQKTWLILFITKKFIIPTYVNFIYVFSKKLLKILPKQIGINKHAIKLENNKQSPYKQIHNL